MKQEPIYIYGKHAVVAALTERPDCLLHVYFQHEFDDGELRSAVKKHGIPIDSFSEKKMPGRISKDATHQGVVAAIDESKLLIPYHDFMTSLSVTQDTAVVILGEIQDTHNVGAVIRSAAAFGVGAVFIPAHNQAPVTGAVVKVSAGTAFTVPLVAIGNVNTVARDLKERGFWVYGLAGEGDVSIYEELFTKPTAFILGNEGTGLREKTREVCDTLLTIPMHERAESLNAAVSAGVVFSHWSKQHPRALGSI